MWGTGHVRVDTHTHAHMPTASNSECTQEKHQVWLMHRVHASDELTAYCWLLPLQSHSFSHEIISLPLLLHIEYTLQVSKPIIFFQEILVFFPPSSQQKSSPFPIPTLPRLRIARSRRPEGEAALPPRKGDFVELIVRRMPRMVSENDPFIDDFFGDDRWDLPISEL